MVGRPSRVLLPALALVLSGAVRAGADEPDPLVGLKRSQAKRLSDVAAAARDARLGSAALRLWQDALALDPEQAAARAALGWTREGAGWKAPDPRLVVGDGWPDDGEASLGKIAKQEAAARAAIVKDCLDATAAAKARKAPPDLVDRFLWAAIAAERDDETARRLLAHRVVAGRWAAREHEPLLDGPPAAVRAELRRALATEAVEVRDVDPTLPTPAGWAAAIPRGRADPEGDSVFSLTDPGFCAGVARDLGRARRFLSAFLGPAAASSSPPAPLAFLHVGSRALADVLLAADPGLSAALRDLARRWPTFPLSGSGWVVVVGESPEAASDAAVSALVEGVLRSRAAVPVGTWWLRLGAAHLATSLLFGSPRGYAMTATGFGGDPGPTRRAGESLLAFVRRLAVADADATLAVLATREETALYPRDVAKAWCVLDWLHLRDPASCAAFVRGTLEALGDGPARLEAAAKAAGFPSADAMDAAWRRFAIDLYPDAGPDVGGGAWKVTKLDRAKTLPPVDSQFEPVARPVAGSLWLHGRPYTCEVVDNGAAVRLYPLREGQPRTVREPGVYPYALAREYGGGFVDYRVDLRREGTAWTVRSADAWTGNVDGQPMTFLDLDLDGRFGSFGRDAVVVGQGAFALPLRRDVVLGGRHLSFRRVGPDGQEVAWRAAPVAARGADLEALLLVNDWRAAAGLTGLAWDTGLAWQAAAAFGEDGSPSEPSGAVLVAGAPMLTSAVRRLAADPVRRTLLLDPAALRLGAAVRGGNAVLRFAGGDASEPSAPLHGPLPFPGPGAVEVPRAGPTGSGFVLSLAFSPGRDLATVGATVTLSAGAGAAVETQPVSAAALEGAPTGLVAFATSSPLAARTVHRVNASWSAGASRTSRTWTFRTGD